MEKGLYHWSRKLSVRVWGKVRGFCCSNTPFSTPITPTWSYLCLLKLVAVSFRFHLICRLVFLICNRNGSTYQLGNVVVARVWPLTTFCRTDKKKGHSLEPCLSTIYSASVHLQYYLKISHVKEVPHWLQFKTRIRNETFRVKEFSPETCFRQNKPYVRFIFLQASIIMLHNCTTNRPFLLHSHYRWKWWMNLTLTNAVE